jgi:hypothetical protein
MGVYAQGRLAGAMTFGDPLDRRRVLPLVEGTPWEGVCELNRMALDPALPPNSESRVLAVALRILKARAHHLEWVLSYADATRCGDGTIYRATGWLLTDIKPNRSLWEWPNGEVYSDVGIRTSDRLRRWVASQGDGITWAMTGKASTWRALGARPIAGHQIRYIYPLRDGVRERLTCDVLPYAAIDDARAGMYLGVPRTSGGRSCPASAGGSNPTPGLS